MPYILLIIVLLVLAKLPVEAATLKGVILANELGGPPIAGVGLVADGANPDTSEDFGRFTLEFPQKKPGDRVEIVVKQEGYVVVNDAQLQLTLPTKALLGMGEKEREGWRTADDAQQPGGS